MLIAPSFTLKSILKINYLAFFLQLNCWVKHHSGCGGVLIGLQNSHSQPSLLSSSIAEARKVKYSPLQPSCSWAWPCYTVLANENFLGKFKNLLVLTFSLLPILSVDIIPGVARVTLKLSERPRISQRLSSNGIGPADPLPAVS